MAKAKLRYQPMRNTETHVNATLGRIKFDSKGEAELDNVSDADMEILRRHRWLVEDKPTMHTDEQDPPAADEPEGKRSKSGR